MKIFSNYVGIDVSKKTLDVVLHNTVLKNKSPHLKVSNTTTGHNGIMNWLNSYSVSPKDTLFCMEYTGIYSNEIASFLYQKGLSYTLVSPLHMKRSMGLVRGKNDKADAYYIARYCYTHKDELVCAKGTLKALRDIKCLISERMRLTKLSAAN